MSTVNHDCPNVRQHLALYAGRDLEAALCTQVEQHLAGCDACRDELAITLAARERIRVFGAETAQGLEAVDLWPAVRDSWAREQLATREEVAALNLSRPRSMRRYWLPISLAAAAALFFALRSALTPDAITEDKTPNVVEHVAPNIEVQPAAAGSLRRASPGEERLRDSSVPLFGPSRFGNNRAGTTEPNSLAGDDGLR